MKCQLNQVTYDVKRLKFRRWLELEALYNEVTRSATADNVCKYVSVALSVSVEELQDLPWIEVATAFFTAVQINNSIEKLPIHTAAISNQKTPPYDYPGRTFYALAHSIAKSYGWTIEYIAEMEVDDVFKFIQEIQIDEQQEREWDWDLSDRAFSYEETSKKYKYNPLPKPNWMESNIDVSHFAKPGDIPETFKPVGNVIRLDGKPANA